MARKKEHHPTMQCKKWNLIGSDVFFQPMAEQQMPTAGLEGEN
jgi:hypothetical protein